MLALTLGLSLALIPRRTAFADQPAGSIQPVGQIEKVASDFKFTEGPAWNASTQTLWFTDIPNASIHELLTDGSIRVLTKDSKHTNGLLMPIDGRVLGCQMDGAVVEYDSRPSETLGSKTSEFTETILASQFNGQRFNAPNDLTVDSEGGIYFTDPLFRAPQPLPQEIQSVYYISKDGTVSRVTQDIPAPNGIGISIDKKHLYVCPSQQAEMLIYDIEGPGKLGSKRVFCKVKQPAGETSTGADGITLDVKGNVYITTHLGVQVFSPTGNPVGLVEFPEQPANVCFGGKEWKTLYVTARQSVYRVEMPIAGFIPGNFQ